MKRSSRQIYLAGALLMAAFTANLWLQVSSWEYYIQGYRVHYAFFFVDSWIQQVLYWIAALFLGSFALIGSLIGLISRRSWPIVAGAFGYVAMLPIEYISLSFSFGPFGPLAVLPQVANQDGMRSYLHYVGIALAVTSLAVILKRDKPRGLLEQMEPKGDLQSSLSMRRPLVERSEIADAEMALAPQSEGVKPVAYDTQTGRPILRYDTRTGQPIYADEPGATQ